MPLALIKLYLPLFLALCAVLFALSACACRLMKRHKYADVMTRCYVICGFVAGIVFLAGNFNDLCQYPRCEQANLINLP